MLNAAKHAAKLEGNLCFLGDFATDADYALTEEGNLAFEYGVGLADVAAKIRENDKAMDYYYMSLGYEPSR